MDQTARGISVAKFAARKSTVLVVTDVAARGIDIPLLDNVVNFDFPARAKLFVHRVGRAARAGRSGTAFSLLVRSLRTRRPVRLRIPGTGFRVGILGMTKQGVSGSGDMDTGS